MVVILSFRPNIIIYLTPRSCYNNIRKELPLTRVELNRCGLSIFLKIADVLLPLIGAVLPKKGQKVDGRKSENDT